MSKIAIIIPCYNEAERLQATPILEWVRKNIDYEIFFVDDGSTDETLNTLSSLSKKYPAQIHVIPLGHNKGKGEAIRSGCQTAMNGPFTYIGYLDADLSTPLQEFKRLGQLIETNNHTVICGSRIKKAGTLIKRSGFRHITGRIIATIIDTRFNLGIYDTQCGSKIFETRALKEVIQKPFLTQWFFDVEIFLRLRDMHTLRIHEEPLKIWEDRKSSKLNFLSLPLICKELFILLSKY